MDQDAVKSNELNTLLRGILKRESLIGIVASNLRRKDSDTYRKVEVRPVRLKEELEYQLTYTYDQKVTHENMDGVRMSFRILELMENKFKQLQIFTLEADYQILVSKRGKMTILQKKPTQKAIQSVEHNRKKNYLLPEDEPNDFLIRLGVMSANGKVIGSKYDKFRQINRFLELVSDVTPKLQGKNRRLNIIDFGCGKSYLTFAMYDYLHVKLGMDIHVIGLDLKADVVKQCNQIADDLHYDQLHFYVGDIGAYEQSDKIDMVVTLHACDTATDAALEKAVRWGAEVILSVPCCQHELLPQIHNVMLNSMEKHGIIKERMASLVTDSLRANILELMGYSVQIVEFIDMEHTPKNILIRALKTGKVPEQAMEDYYNLKEFWGFDSYLERALADRLK